MNRYDYDELRKNAESGKLKDINALGEWFSRYGEVYWNGEYYDADGIEIVPRHDDNGNVICYESR